MIVDVLAATAVAIVAVVAFLAARYRAPDHSVYDSPKTEPVIADADVSPQHNDVVRTLGDFNRNNTSKDIHVARKRMEELFYRDVEATVVPVSVDGMPGEWVLADRADPTRRLLYLRGGAFRVGSPRSHRRIYFRAVQAQRRCCSSSRLSYAARSEDRPMPRGRAHCISVDPAKRAPDGQRMN